MENRKWRMEIREPKLGIGNWIIEPHQDVSVPKVFAPSTENRKLHTGNSLHPTA
jgi:hypothetical protein